MRVPAPDPAPDPVPVPVPVPNTIAVIVVDDVGTGAIGVGSRGGDRDGVGGPRQ